MTVQAPLLVASHWTLRCDGFRSGVSLSEFDELHFVVPGKPQAKQRARAGRGGRHYTPKETRQYEELVKWIGIEATSRWRKMLESVWLKTGTFALGVTAYVPDRRRRDLSNIEKSIEDGLNGVTWDDDCQIKRRLEGGIEYDKDEPRVEVVVRRIA